jgi:acetyl esterase/lipase
MTTHLRMTLLFLVATAAFPALGADEEKSPSSQVATAYDVVYRKVGETELKIDIAQPAEGNGPFPIVFVIHGGAWRSGSKDGMRGALLEFAKRGYVAASPQYRFCPKETFPAQVHDVKAAVRWMKTHATEYKGDPDHIGAMGFSAGGHLSMMLGVTGPDDGLEGDAPKDAPSTKIQAVVNYFGPTDLAADDFPNVTKPLINDFLGGTPTEKAKEAAQASPLTFVSKDDPPILSFQGTKDPLVPYSQTIKLATAQTEKGIPGRVDLLLGMGHGWGGEDFKRTTQETFEFFDRYLKPSRKSAESRSGGQKP